MLILALGKDRNCRELNLGYAWGRPTDPGNRIFCQTPHMGREEWTVEIIQLARKRSIKIRGVERSEKERKRGVESEENATEE